MIGNSVCRADTPNPTQFSTDFNRNQRPSILPSMLSEPASEVTIGLRFFATGEKRIPTTTKNRPQQRQFGQARKIFSGSKALDITGIGSNSFRQVFLRQFPPHPQLGDVLPKSRSLRTGVGFAHRHPRIFAQKLNAAGRSKFMLFAPYRIFPTMKIGWMRGRKRQSDGSLRPSRTAKLRGCSFNRFVC